MNMNYLDVICRYAGILLITLFVSLSVVAQEAEDEAESEEESAIDTPLVSKPQRLASALPRNKYPKNDQSYMQLLASHLPQDGLVWVEHYPEPFLGYWQEDRSGKPKGAVLILHSEGANPVWQTTTRAFHESFPEYGWATLAISLPDHESKAVPPRSLPVKTVPIKPNDDEDETDADTEVADSELVAPEEVATQNSAPLIPATPSSDSPTVSEIIDKRLESALRFLHDNGQFNIIMIGAGMNAIVAQQFSEKITPKIENAQLQGQLEKPIRAIVLINTKNRLPTMEQEFDGWFSDPALPVLDIYFRQDSRNQYHAEKRKRLASQQGATAYQQVAINEVSAERSWGENKLSRRVRSFLEKNASGVEVRGVLLNR